VTLGGSTGIVACRPKRFTVAPLAGAKGQIPSVRYCQTPAPPENPMNAERRFLLSQGFPEPAPESCGLHFGALQFQPRVIGIVLVVGMILQTVASLPSVVLFVMLGVVLWWGALRPNANVFEWAYNLTSPRYRLTRAPAPRRFAQGLAGTMALVIAAFLYMHWMPAAVVVELLLLAAVAGILFAKFCFGSWLYNNVVRR
jgi:hypothetical protein